MYAGQWRIDKTTVSWLFIGTMVGPKGCTDIRGIWWLRRGVHNMWGTIIFVWSARAYFAKISFFLPNESSQRHFILYSLLFTVYLHLFTFIYIYIYIYLHLFTVYYLQFIIYSLLFTVVLTQSMWLVVCTSYSEISCVYNYFF